ARHPLHRTRAETPGRRLPPLPPVRHPTPQPPRRNLMTGKATTPKTPTKTTTKATTKTTTKAATKAVAKATTRKPRAATKTQSSAQAPTRFPTELLFVIDVAVEGPLGPGGIAHRIARYPITVTDPDGRHHYDELVGPACGTTTTRPGPDHDTDESDIETVPV